MNTTRTRLIKILVEQLNVNGDQITDDSNLKEDLGMDSLDTVEVSICIEDEFKITINVEETEVLAEGTFADLVGRVDAKLAA